MPGGLPSAQQAFPAQLAQIEQRLAQLETFIRLLAARPTWRTPTLENSWANVGGAGIEVAGYTKNALGEVRIKGRIKGGASGSQAFVLPEGFRPGGTGTYASSDQGATSGAIVITATGAVNVFWSTNNNDCGLSGITFLAEN